MSKFIKVIIPVFIVFFCISLLILFYTNKSIKNCKKQNISIVTKKTEIHNETKNAYNKIKHANSITAKNIVQDVLLKELEFNNFILNSKNKTKNDNEFYKFYKYLTDKYNLLFDILVDYNYSGFIEDCQPEQIIYSGITFKLIYDTWDIYKIIKPKTELFTWQINREFQTLSINDNYLYDKYSKYLSQELQEFLYLSKTNREPFSADGGYNATKEELYNFIKSWREFSIKYPNFKLKNYVEGEINFFAINFINIFYDYDDDTLILDDKVKDIFEKYLSETDSEYSEYQIILRAYEILKDYDFKFSDEYYNYVRSFSEVF